MSTALKDLYNKQFITELNKVLAENIPGFNSAAFTKSVFNSEWQNLELKQRMHHIKEKLHLILPSDFAKAAPILKGITTSIKKIHGEGMSFLYMFLPEYIATYGLQHYKQSVQLLEQITQVTSAEFAVRPFIIQYPDAMMQQMEAWSKHKSLYVRRLSSEGCRPRLPWGMGLPVFKKDPSPVLPILENLKNDDAETVRRSVANNLNDIAKDHPALVLSLIKKWQGKSKNTDWIIKHGSRTLLKQGNLDAMSHFGNHKIKTARIQNLRSGKSVKIGNTLQFQFDILHTEKLPVIMRVDYAIYYVKSAGKLSKKVFRLREGNFEPGKKYTITKNQHFKDLTTRKHFTGAHTLSIIVNGIELEKIQFNVLK